MKKQYQDWIDQHYPTFADALGNCRQAVREMAEAFPELIICRGFVKSWVMENKTEHWWLKTSAGETIDPTAVQYGAPMIMEYEEVGDDHPAVMHPRRRCPNCGEYFYTDRRGICCSDHCENEYIDWMNGKPGDGLQPKA